MIRMRYVGLLPGYPLQFAYQCPECALHQIVAEGEEIHFCPECDPPEDPHKWDRRFLQDAKDWALACSKDPSTKVGAVIVGPDRDIVSKGYNGFARKVTDTPERYADRDTKLGMVVHAEANAILFADRWRLKGATLYTWPFQPCSNCAALVIQAGITRVVAPPCPPETRERWAISIELAEAQFAEAGVELVILPDKA